MLISGYSLSASKTYTGKVVSPITFIQYSGTDAANSGLVDYVARVGEIVYPPIYDMKGNVLKAGSVILTLKKKYFEDKVKSAEDAVLSSKADMLTQKENYIRFKNLSAWTVASKRKFQAVRAGYLDSVAVYEENMLQLDKARIILKGCTIIAPFEGVIDEVYFLNGLSGYNPRVFKISQLNPIGIKVKMPRIEANRIKQYTPVKIYPVGSTIPHGVFYGYSILEDDGITFLTENETKFMANKDIREGNKPEVRINFPVIKFYTDELKGGTLAVPLETILKDEKGEYVWKAGNEKTMQPGKGMKLSFSIEKTYVVTDNLERYWGGITKIVALKDAGNLKENDIVLKDSFNKYNKLKDGETVYIGQLRYIFMPGEKIKVEIGE